MAESREALLRDWLEAVDSVERACGWSAGQTRSFDGLRAVLEQMEAILARQGMTRVGAPGEQFDPERHEAVDVRRDRRACRTARSSTWRARDGRPATGCCARRR